MAVPNTMRRILLAAIPDCKPQPSNFRIEEAATPGCPPDGLLVRTVWLSVDPYLRGRITGKRTYVDPIPVGDVMVSGAVGEVVESQSPRFSAGDFVSGMWGWQDYAGVPAKGVLKLDPSQAPVSTPLFDVNWHASCSCLPVQASMAACGGVPPFEGWACFASC